MADDRDDDDRRPEPPRGDNDDRGNTEDHLHFSPLTIPADDDKVRKEPLREGKICVQISIYLVFAERPVNRYQEDRARRAREASGARQGDDAY